MQLRIPFILSILSLSLSTAAPTSDPDAHLDLDLYRRDLEDALFNYLEAREAFVDVHWYAQGATRRGGRGKRDADDVLDVDGDVF